jgi:hypothetical protein
MRMCCASSTDVLNYYAAHDVCKHLIGQQCPAGAATLLCIRAPFYCTMYSCTEYRTPEYSTYVHTCMGTEHVVSSHVFMHLTCMLCCPGVVHVIVSNATPVCVRAAVSQTAACKPCHTGGFRLRVLLPLPLQACHLSALLSGH